MALRWEVLGELRPKLEFVTDSEQFGRDRSERVLAALEVARIVHEGQTRDAGEPYIEHCVAVASLLSAWGASEDEVVAGLLHDTVEDHPDRLSLAEIEEVFGTRVARLVNGVTKFRSESVSKEEQDFETLRKVTRETLMEYGVALIKLADRFHNMTTMMGVREDKRKVKALETEKVYCPLAESMGLWRVKVALKDMAFAYTNPDRFVQVKKQIDSDKRLNAEFIEARKIELAAVLETWGINGSIEVRVAGYKEMEDKRRRSGLSAEGNPKSFEQMTDLLSLRIILDDEEIRNCYLAKAAVEHYFGAAVDASRDDDYIARQAVNGYQAIHKSVRFAEGLVEIAITTRKREEYNNWGILSMEEKEREQRHDDYVRKMIFAPNGELVFMPMEAKGVDVAYSLDPWLGLKATAMIVDGVEMLLSMEVPNASEVEIVLDERRNKPDLEWLEYCLPATRVQIERQLVTAEREEVIGKGRDLVREILMKRGILELNDLELETRARILAELGCHLEVSRLYFKAGYGFDLNRLEDALDREGLVAGVYTSIEVRGTNSRGISSNVAQIITRHGGDVRRSVERVERDQSFVIRKLIKALTDEEKNEMERELKSIYQDVIVV